VHIKKPIKQLFITLVIFSRITKHIVTKFVSCNQLFNRLKQTTNKPVNYQLKMAY